ncbi:MAG TPA: histidine kinase [Actinomycetota bacterium]|nr:histidine kinase [Actinomycetota bacterium]
MTKRSARLAATASSITVACLSVGQTVLFILDRTARIHVYGIRGFQMFLALSLVIMGALILRRRPENPIGWLFCAGAIFGSLQGIISEYAVFSIVRHHASLPLTTFGAWLQNWIWILFVAAAGIISFQLFPTGSTLSPRWRKAMIGSGVGVALFCIAFSIQPGQVQQVTVGFQNPYQVGKPLASALMAIGGILFIASIAVALASVIVRFRRSHGDEREQLKWLAFAAGFLLVAFVGNGVTASLNRTSSPARGVAIFTLFTLAIIIVTTGLAIIKYRLYDIDIVISRALVFSAIVLFITAVYVALVAGIGAALRGTSRSTLWLSILATAIVATALQPLRERAKRLANRIVYGQRATPYEALSGFASRISDAYSMEEVLPRLARLMTEATAATQGVVWLAGGPGLHAAAVWPEGELPSSRSLADGGHGIEASFPVRHQGELLGELTVATRPGEPLNPTDSKVLSDLAAQAGLVLRNVRLITDLQASRQRLVTAQDQERRRIERNLHDGAQQQLVALSVKLKLARTLLERDVTQVDGMLEQLQLEARDALENLRALAHGIYPPLLAERGLAQALAAQAEKAAVPVSVDANGLGRYAQEAEAAIYFCVLECMQNAAKYSRAHNVQIRLTSGDGRLGFVVADDGSGFDVETTSRGAGLTNMTDRLEALGGALEVRSSPGEGTQIEGWVSTATQDGSAGSAPAASSAPSAR